MPQVSSLQELLVIVLIPVDPSTSNAYVKSVDCAADFVAGNRIENRCVGGGL